ncbi:hypothetical protein PMI41_04636 [Phyllobacterium sp. YR531]|nr:hypothetical protein PMI41_04636 [Phyllobacterium sp. YR531]
MAGTDLYTPDVDTAADQTGGAGMAQNMRDSAKSNLAFASFQIARNRT